MVAVAEADRSFRSAVLGEGGSRYFSLLDNLPPVCMMQGWTRSKQEVSWIVMNLLLLWQGILHVWSLKLQSWFVLFLKYVTSWMIWKKMTLDECYMNSPYNFTPKWIQHSTLMSLEASVAMLRELDPESRLERIARGLGGWIFQEFMAVWYPKHPG